MVFYRLWKERTYLWLRREVTLQVLKRSGLRSLFYYHSQMVSSEENNAQRQRLFLPSPAFSVQEKLKKKVFQFIRSLELNLAFSLMKFHDSLSRVFADSEVHTAICVWSSERSLIKGLFHQKICSWSSECMPQCSPGSPVYNNSQDNGSNLNVHRMEWNE